jgi:hypothetical protein
MIEAITKWAERRSLTVSLLALVVSWSAAGIASTRLSADVSGVLAAGWVAVSFCCSCFGFVNLVRDVERGYAPDRCSLAAVILTVAILPPLLALGWLGWRITEWGWQRLQALV